MKRYSFKNGNVRDSGTMELRGIEDYHIARAEGVETSLDTYLAVSAKEKQEDQRGVVVELRHKRVFVRVANRVVNAAGRIGVIAYSR